MITPVLFQWYNLFNTFPKFVARYQKGYQLELSGNLMILIGAIIIGAMVYLFGKCLFGVVSFLILILIFQLRQF